MEKLNTEWLWARSLTYDLLKVCNQNDLNYRLNNKFGELWKQFRHIGRVQENYLNALITGKVVFSTGNCSYKNGASKEKLINYFEDLEVKHKQILDNVAPNILIDWNGEKVTLDIHLTRLISHETLHHGQLILIWKSLENKFPTSWEDWGE